MQGCLPPVDCGTPSSFFFDETASNPTMRGLSELWTAVRGLTAFVATTSTRLRGAMTTTRPPAVAAPLQRDGLQCWTGPLKWTSEQGEVRVNGEPFHIKGTNW